MEPVDGRDRWHLHTDARRVLLVAYHFPPLAVIGTARAVRFVRSLQEAGVEVAVLTATCDSAPPAPIDPEAYPRPEGVFVERARSFDVVAELSRRLRFRSSRRATDPEVRKTHERNGVRGEVADRKRLRPWRWMREGISQLLQVPDLYTGWLPQAKRAGIRLVRTFKPDLVLATSPPQSALLLGALLARERRCPLVADFRDPWVDNPYRGQTWLPHVRWFDARLEAWLVRRARGLIANTPALARSLVRRYPRARNRTVVIANGIDSHFVPPPEDMRMCARSCLHVLHLGSLYAERSPACVVEAVEKLLREGVVSRDTLCVEFLGAFAVPGLTAEDLEQRTRGIVRIRDRVAREKALARARASDVLLLLQPGAPLQVPGKVFEYMALGKEILTIADQGATSELAKAAQLGPVCSPSDPEAIARALMDLMKRKQREALRGPRPEVLRAYSATVQCERLLGLIDRVVRRRSAPSS